MADQLPVVSTQEELLAMFAGEYDLPPSTMQEIDPLAATPVLSHSGGKTKQFTLGLGEEVFENLEGGSFAICILAVYVSHGMFAPDKDGESAADKERRPVCSSQWAPANDQSSMTGVWISKDHDDKRPASADANGVIECATCPYNQWASVGEWTGKEGRGKACGSPAHLLVALTKSTQSIELKGGRSLKLHQLIYPDPVVLHLSATSLGLLKKFAANVAGMRPIFSKAGLPEPKELFLPQTLIQEINKENPKMPFSVLTVEGTNILANKPTMDAIAEMARKVPDLVAGKVRIKIEKPPAVVDDPSKTDADGKPLPF